MTKSMKKGNWKKRLFTLLITFCVLFSAVAVSGKAEAEEVTNQWVSEKESAYSARLEKDITYTLWSYIDERGIQVNNAWKKIGKTWYYFTNCNDKMNYASYARMAANEWVNGYWFNKDGSWTYKPKASWKKDKTGWYYSDTSGWYAKSSWQKIDGKDYYFNAKGYIVTGWKKIGGYWYYFHSDGSMAANEYITFSGNKYYFFGDGSYYDNLL